LNIGATSPSLAGDRALTADRQERKYLLPSTARPSFTLEIERHLRAHHYTGEGANCLPGPQHFVTTIYFDTPSHAQWKRATSDILNNVKVRAKEYYDLHPSLAELATTPDEIVRYRPWLWFELKRRTGNRTEKLRLRLSKLHAMAFFGAGISQYVIDQSATGAGCDELERIVEYCRGIGEPLSASCLVNYQRQAWQDASSTLRVTLDADVAFYEPPPDLWTRKHALLRGSLGGARGYEPRLVVEVKLRGSFPAWLMQALRVAGARETTFSKFARAGQVVYEHG
jgi:hypothetical protein